MVIYIKGADDNLIKVWSAFAGTLRYTFRGHHAEITDLTISFENTILASASIDKTVRYVEFIKYDDGCFCSVWCLMTGATLAVYRTHSSMVTQLSFLPYIYQDDRYLMSTGNDCCVCFYLWNASTKEFGYDHIKLMTAINLLF
jgi:WD40 repeat protein